MTQEDKDLLFKDLCARLPYGVKCKDWTHDENDEPIDTIRILGVMDSETKCYKYRRIYAEHDISRIKPYLRPMSNMTKEEEEYALYTWGLEELCNGIDFLYDNNMMFGSAWEFVDWLNEHHFDYRGLIEKGLALEAPKDMY